MEVGENRVRVFNGTERREGERVEIYTGGISLCTSDHILDLKYVSGTYISIILSNCSTLESVVMELLLFCLKLSSTVCNQTTKYILHGIFQIK
jgi:hypothetical protein